MKNLFEHHQKRYLDTEMPKDLKSEEYTVKTPKGSLIQGTPHEGSSRKMDKHITEHVVPTIKKHLDSIKPKKLVFLQEQHVPGMYMGEQLSIPKELQQYKPHIDTWNTHTMFKGDKEKGWEVDKNSEAFKQLLEKGYHPYDIEASHFAGLSKKVIDSNPQFKLNPESRKRLKSKNFANLHKINLEYIHAIRNQGLLNKVKEYENKGYHVVATPGAEHAFWVKPLLEGK